MNLYRHPALSLQPLLACPLTRLAQSHLSDSAAPNLDNIHAHTAEHMCRELSRPHVGVSQHNTTAIPQVILEDIQASPAEILRPRRCGTATK